jgi:helicase MOV-10
MAGLAGDPTQAVLAGDPKQLGPVIHSGPAKQAGLGLSLLERLTSVAPYAAVVNGDGSSSGSNGSSSGDGLIVKLVRNYRSHPKLLQLPSELFYQGELQACASPEITHTLLHWDKLPNKE